METAPTPDTGAQHDGKNDHCAKSISALKAETKDKLIPQTINTTEKATPPQPGFREVPVQVVKNNARAERAQSPPKSQPSTGPSRRKVREQRGRRKPNGIGDGDDSDSDSERDGRKKRRESPNQILQRQAPQPSAGPDSTATSRSDGLLSPEEAERLETQRSLRRFQEEWGHKMKLRSRFRADGAVERSELVRDRTPSTSNYMSELLSKAMNEQKVLQDYLDESLFSAMVGDRIKETSIHEANPDVSTKLILEAERQVIKFLGRIVRGLGIPSPLTADKHGHYICTGLSHLFSKVSKRYTLKNPAVLSIERFKTQLVAEFYHEAKMNLGFIGKAYMEEIMLEIATYFQCGGTESMPLQQILPNSRGASGLTDHYIEWVWSKCDPTGLKDVLLQGEGRIEEREEIRRVALQEFKNDMHDINISIAQEFYEISHSRESNTVGSVLLKDGRASTLRTVSPYDLSKMGWTHSRSGYWRFAVFDEQPGFVWRVDMDGRTLDLVEEGSDSEDEEKEEGQH
ncbi:hypothetical protein PG991_016124 [Apiospora marii]|uniref:Uncharacterized protein n=1 Tax=Apiospora marii TaxID=335849 RepID=A0ABR1R0T4_9PEZI